jgi:hypothetical protein
LFGLGTWIAVGAQQAKQQGEKETIIFHRFDCGRLDDANLTYQHKHEPTAYIIFP